MQLRPVENASAVRSSTLVTVGRRVSDRAPPRAVAIDGGGLYSLAPRAAESLVPPERCFGVTDTGSASLRRLAAAVRDSGAESVAVCLLRAPADPAAERRVGEALRRLGLPVTLATDLS